MGLAATLSSEQFESFGWRIPFLMSFVLVVVAIFIRLKVDETPAFVALKKTPVKQEKSPLKSAVGSHYKTILRLMLFFCSPAALFYLIVIFSLSYLTKHLGFSQQTGFMSLMVANVCAIFGALAGGYLADRWGRKKALALGSCMTLLILFVYFPILNTLNVPAIMAIMGLFLGFTQFQSGIQPVAFAEAFPTQVRYSGTGLHRRQPGDWRPHADDRRMDDEPVEQLAVASGDAVRGDQPDLAGNDRHRPGNPRHRP
jgi:predicted MFS family arabinose efflux permease